MVTIENEVLSVTIKKAGAEIVSVKDKASDFEFVWQADPNYWARHTPVLFPIVGGLKQGTYQYQWQNYQLPRHGFARDREFQLVEQTATSATYELRSDAQSLAVYPFEFSFKIRYELQANQVTVQYIVHNSTSDQDLYYSVGGHPAFNVVRNQAGEFEKAEVIFEPSRQVTQMALQEEGLIDLTQNQTVTVDKIALQHELFKDDALIYHLDGQYALRLVDYVTGASVSLEAEQLPYLGIWSPYPKQAPFVCLEPWAGITDVATASGEFQEKEAIQHVSAGQTQSHVYTLTFNKTANQ